MLLERQQFRQSLRINLEPGSVAIERNNDLECSRYVIDGRDLPIEIYISDELRNAGLSFKKLKEFGIAELKRIRDEPFGETNIDPHVSENFAREQRAINRIRDDIQSLIGDPIAIKSSTPEGNRINMGGDLIDQYLFMRKLQIVSGETLTAEQKRVIEFLPVYGVVRVGNVGFLIMKLIKRGQEIKDEPVPVTPIGWGYGYPEFEPAFSAPEHKELIDVLRLNYFDGLMKWSYVCSALGRALGIRLHDLAGRNVLCSRNGASKKYTIIDQVRNEIH